MTREVENCENCPFGWLDKDYSMEWQCNEGGQPEQRKRDESIPKDCPLLKESIIVTLKKL